MSATPTSLYAGTAPPPAPRPPEPQATIPIRRDVREALVAGARAAIDRAISLAGLTACHRVDGRLRAGQYLTTPTMELCYADGVLRIVDLRTGETIMVATATHLEAVVSTIAAVQADTPLVLIGQGDAATRLTGEERL